MRAIGRGRDVTIVCVTFQPPRNCLRFHTQHRRLNTTKPKDPTEYILQSTAMGIKHLYQLIDEHTPEAVKKGEIKNQFGRKVAIVCPR